MFRNILKNFNCRFFSTLQKSVLIKSVAEQFEERKKDPKFVTFYNEAQDRVKNLRRHPEKFIPIELDSKKLEKDINETRKHSIY